MVIRFWLLFGSAVAATIMLHRGWRSKVLLSTLESCKHKGKTLGHTTNRVEVMAPSDSDPTFEFVLLALWCLCLWSFLSAAERVKKTKTKVSEPPCGPPNLHLMPIIRFQSWVFWQQPSCCKDYVNDMFTGYQFLNVRRSWIDFPPLGCTPMTASQIALYIRICLHLCNVKGTMQTRAT